MKVIYQLYIFVSTCFEVINTSSQYFSIQTNVFIGGTRMDTARSTLECAAICMKHDDCCVVSFTEVDNICSLTPYCNVEDSPSTGSKTMRRNLEYSSDDLFDITTGLTATQSSTFNGEVPENAIDGNLSTIQHTSLEENPFWIVDLGKMYLVDHVVVYNKNDCCFAERLHDLDVSTGLVTDAMSLCGHFAGPGYQGQIITFYCNPAYFARFVKLSINGTEELHVSEVKIYGTEKDP